MPVRTDDFRAINPGALIIIGRGHQAALCIMPKISKKARFFFHLVKLIVSFRYRRRE